MDTKGIEGGWELLVLIRVHSRIKGEPRINANER